MMLRVLVYYVCQAFYDLRACFGYNVVLLDDPRWIDPLPPTDWDDLDLF